MVIRKLIILLKTNVCKKNSDCKKQNQCMDNLLINNIDKRINNV